MKILNLEEFRKMPEGTVFCKYEPCCFEVLQMKGETWEHDFVCQELVGNVNSNDSGDYADKCTLAEHGESIELDFNFYGRDGCFEKDQLFAVYERKDILGLVNCLMSSIGDKSDYIITIESNNEKP